MPSVYEVITNEIIKKLDEGVKPWKKEFNGTKGMPRNLISNKPYQGINTLMLLSQGFLSPFWCTFKQISDRGGKIKKGEKHTKVVFWSTMDKENEEGKERKIPFMRYYRVWNIQQTEDVSLPKYANVPEEIEEVTPIEACENIVNGFKDCPEILFGRKPHYNPTYDQIGMPKIEQFHSPEFFYGTLFHEMIHATKHMTRLNREGISYAQEELVAEIGACFLSGIAGISEKIFDNQVSYIHGWGQKTEMSCVEWKNFLKSNPKALVQAASQAQKAADYVQGINEMTKLKEKHEKEIA
jgi:antirestriction protein ArdC